MRFFCVLRDRIAWNWNSLMTTTVTLIRQRFMVPHRCMFRHCRCRRQLRCSCRLRREVASWNFYMHAVASTATQGYHLRELDGITIPSYRQPLSTQDFCYTSCKIESFNFIILVTIFGDIRKMCMCLLGYVIRHF